MSDAKCYLCTKPGKFEKLFRKCKHESACYDCLRDRYVTQAQHEALYPLKCFHPECNLAVCNTQMRRLVRSVQELQNFHRLDRKAKSAVKLQKVKAMMQALNAQKDAKIKTAMDVAMQKANWGENWSEVWEGIREALGDAFAPHEIRPCPKCTMLITKNGGCSHMRCVCCGCRFSWTAPSPEAIRKIQEYYRPMEEKYSRYVQFYNGMIIPSRSLQMAAKWKANRAPLVRIDEEDDFVEDYSFEDDEESSDFVETTEDCDDLISGFTSDLDSISFPSVSLIGAVDLRTEWDQGDFEILELASSASDDSWSRFDSSQTKSSCNHTSAWEEVSEVSSVVSFHSNTGMSFLEAARLGAASTQQQQQNGQKRLKLVKPRRKIPQREKVAEDDEMFGPEFLYEGAKGARGGKAKFRFNHEKKTTQGRYEQRRRSIARLREPYNFHGGTNKWSRDVKQKFKTGLLV